MNRKRNTISNSIVNNFTIFSHNFSFKFKIFSLFCALFWSEIIEVIFFCIQHLRAIHYPIQLHRKSTVGYLLNTQAKLLHENPSEGLDIYCDCSSLSLSCWREEKRKTCYVPFSPFHVLEIYNSTKLLVILRKSCGYEWWITTASCCIFIFIFKLWFYTQNWV